MAETSIAAASRRVGRKKIPKRIGGHAMILATPLPQKQPAACFPLIGEAHPLRRSHIRRLCRAFAAAGLIHLAAFSAFLGPHTREPVRSSNRIVIVNPQALPQPPSNHQEPAPTEIRVAIESGVGVPVPVPDFSAALLTLPTNREMVDGMNPLNAVDIWKRRGDSIVVEMPSPSGREPPPADFLAVEEKPSLISFPAPVYPTLARQAEVEGTVLLRVLVGKDGKVADVVVVRGIEMLNDASVEAARRAIFRPALQQHRPVSVWVEIPLQFRLHD
jgi:protein TonB